VRCEQSFPCQLRQHVHWSCREQVPEKKKVIAGVTNKQKKVYDEVMMVMMVCANRGRHKHKKNVYDDGDNGVCFQ